MQWPPNTRCTSSQASSTPRGRSPRTDLPLGTSSLDAREGAGPAGAGASGPQITQGIKDKAESAKAYIEQKYQKLKTDEQDRKQGKWRVTAAWEMLQKKMQNLNLSEAEQELIKNDILHKEAELNRKM